MNSLVYVAYILLLLSRAMANRRMSQAKKPTLTLTLSTGGGWACLLSLLTNGYTVVISPQCSHITIRKTTSSRTSSLRKVLFESITGARYQCGRATQYVLFTNGFGLSLSMASTSEKLSLPMRDSGEASTTEATWQSRDISYTVCGAPLNKHHRTQTWEVIESSVCCWGLCKFIRMVIMVMFAWHCSGLSGLSGTHYVCEKFKGTRPGKEAHPDHRIKPGWQLNVYFCHYTELHQHISNVCI